MLAVIWRVLQKAITSKRAPDFDVEYFFKTPSGGKEPAAPHMMQSQRASQTMAHEHHQRHRGPHEGGMMRERGEAPPDAPRFSAAQAMAARSYFEEEGHQGYVPSRPMRSGQAPMMPMHRWQLGQPLPSGVMSYPLPRPLILAMGTAPAGYRYVRMGGDILLVSESSGMVVDVIEEVAR